MELDLNAFSRFTRGFHGDEIIFSEYEPGDTFYVIQSGRVKLYRSDGEFERTLAVIQAPEMFGEMAILEGSPRSATAVAVDEVKVLEFNAQNFEILLTGNPQIGLNLLRIFSKRIYDSKRRYMILTLQNPQAKIADVFLMLDEALPDVEKKTDSREFKTTIEEIANWAGVSDAEAKEILHAFTVQNRLDIFATRMVVKNINDFARIVSSRRKLEKNPTGIKT